MARSRPRAVYEDSHRSSRRSKRPASRTTEWRSARGAHRTQAAARARQSSVHVGKKAQRYGLEASPCLVDQLPHPHARARRAPIADDVFYFIFAFQQGERADGAAVGRRWPPIVPAAERNAKRAAELPGRRRWPPVPPIRRDGPGSCARSGKGGSLINFLTLTRARGGRRLQTTFSKQEKTRRLLTNRPCLGFVHEESLSKRTSTRQQLDCAKTL